MKHRDPVAKRLLRYTYTVACGLQGLCNLVVPRRNVLSVYYGGARKGDIGGPLVKVKRLREFFPEVRWGYNVVYLLSNTPYLPEYAIDLLKRRKLPIVYNQNGVFYKAWYAGDWEAQNRRMAHAYHAADWVFYQSDFCRSSAERFLGYRYGGGEILYNAVDTHRFMPRCGGDRAGRSVYVFLITGKIDDHLYYRLESTIMGLEQARRSGLDARLVIAGWVATGARQRAGALAKRLDIDSSVEFTGPYTQAEAPEIYRRADAYLMTKHNDPCPNTVIEALSCGLPVLYSRTGGVSELVGEEAGIGLACQESWDEPHAPSAESIAQGMHQIVSGHARFSAQARLRAVERFDIVHWIERHRVIFNQLVAGQ